MASRISGTENYNSIKVKTPTIDERAQAIRQQRDCWKTDKDRADDVASDNVGDQVASQGTTSVLARGTPLDEHGNCWKTPGDRMDDIERPEPMKNFQKTRAHIFHTAANTFADVPKKDTAALEKFLHHRGTPTVEGKADAQVAAAVIMGFMNAAYEEDLDLEMWTGKPDTSANPAEREERQKELQERIAKLTERLSNDPAFAAAIAEASNKI